MSSAPSPTPSADAPPKTAAERLTAALSPKFWRSWAWLAALVGGFIPVVLPDILNWGLSHMDVLLDFAFPTMNPDTKVLVLKIVVSAVLVLRALPQKNMAPAALATNDDGGAPHFPDTQAPLDYHQELERIGAWTSPAERRRQEEAAAQEVFARHARRITDGNETQP